MTNTINNNQQAGTFLENQIELLCQYYRGNKTEQIEAEGLTACYERLSQEDSNNGESNSIANQRKILESYCKTHSYTNIQHYDEDDGYSGTNFNRPSFQKMLADIKAGKVKRVIVKDMSRLGRDYLQVGMYTDIVFPEFGVHFVAVNDGVDSKRGDSEFTAIRNVFNEMFARDTSKKIKATWQAKSKSGERLSTNAPYGYIKDPNDKTKWIVNEETAAVVQKIFALCIDGKGPAQIAAWLEEHGISNPTAYNLKHGLTVINTPTTNPCKWNSTIISKMLERLEYLGHTVNFKTYRQSFKTKKKLNNDPDKWVIVENTHEAIIKESVFEIVQNLRKNRKRPTITGDMGLFSGILYCEDCGSKMYLCQSKSIGAEKSYYICSQYRKDRELCTTHTIRNVVLEEIVLQNLRQAIAYVSKHEDDFIREAADLSMREHDRGILASKEALRKSEKRIDELDNIIKRLYEDNLTGKLTDERFMKMSRDYELEQEKLRVAIDDMSREVKQSEQKRHNTKAFIAATRKYTDLKKLDGTVIREFIDRIEISAIDKKSKVRRVSIVYNFIGAFDFSTVSEITEVERKERKTA
jgi:DNA invertase Pin-like site-specific DNA recombinase